jgi:hypothetical protein
MSLIISEAVKLPEKNDKSNVFHFSLQLLRKTFFFWQIVNESSSRKMQNLQVFM